MVLQDYLALDVLFPIFVALFSIFLAWYCTRLLDNEDDEEDETLVKQIKATLNPDKVSAQQSTADRPGNGNGNEDVNSKPKCSSEKTVQNLEEHMSEEEMENERRIQQEQLQNIFKLMEEDKEKYGISSIGDVKEQLKRYKAE